jgi:hypothetical protein
MRRFLLRCVCACFVGLTALLWSAAPVAGQTVWTRPYQNNQVSLEIIGPQFENEAIDPTSGAAYLSTTHSLTDNIELVAELPAARLDSAGTSESVIGNPYVGVGFSGTRTPFLIELGLRLPVLDDPGAAAFAGSFTDVARTRAFQFDETLISGFANWRVPLGRASSVRLRGGAVYAEFPNRVDGRRRVEQDVRLKYNAQLWYEGDRTVLGLTLAGQGTLTAPGGYGSKSRHWIAGTIIGDFDVVRPGLLIGVSLDEVVRNDAPLFIGLTLSTSYGG